MSETLSAEELAKLAQNPVGNLISVPFQNNTNLNVGPDKRTQNILNIQPVIPIEINKDWNLITRTIMPRSASCARCHSAWSESSTRARMAASFGATRQEQPRKRTLTSDASTAATSAGVTSAPSP